MYRVIKKSLCTWWLQYRKLQVMFKVSPTSLQTFIDTRLTLTPSVIPNLLHCTETNIGIFRECQSVGTSHCLITCWAQFSASLDTSCCLRIIWRSCPTSQMTRQMQNVRTYWGLYFAGWSVIVRFVVLRVMLWHCVVRPVVPGVLKLCCASETSAAGWHVREGVHLVVS
jgi:hypothetical protein